MGTVDKQVTIREDQGEWLDNHPEINASGLLQQAIDREMERRDD